MELGLMPPPIFELISSMYDFSSWLCTQVIGHSVELFDCLLTKVSYERLTRIFDAIWHLLLFLSLRSVELSSRQWDGLHAVCFSQIHVGCYLSPGFSCAVRCFDLLLDLSRNLTRYTGTWSGIECKVLS